MRLPYLFCSNYAQILVNLVNNGIKFTETGSVVISVDVKHETPESCEFLFNVCDTGTPPLLCLSPLPFLFLVSIPYLYILGIGIAQEDVGKLFKRFSQLNSQRYGGSGLGLAISAEVCFPAFIQTHKCERIYLFILASCFSSQSLMSVSNFPPSVSALDGRRDWSIEWRAWEGIHDVVYMQA